MLITPEFVENFMKLGVAAVAFTLLLFISMNIIDRFMQANAPECTSYVGDNIPSHAT